MPCDPEIKPIAMREEMAEYEERAREEHDEHEKYGIDGDRRRHVSNRCVRKNLRKAAKSQATKGPYFE